MALRVEDFVQRLTTRSHENFLVVGTSKLRQTQDFLYYHPVRITVTPNQPDTAHMLDALLSKVGAQKMDTSFYQLSDVGDSEFQWEDPDIHTDTALP